MNQRLTSLVSFMLLLVMAVVFTLSVAAKEQDSKLVSLGNPLAQEGKQERALNVWDLQVFDEKVYLAGGDTTTNAGPVGVWAYDPKQQTFIKEYTVPEEAIEHYRLFDNQLYIPAADPRKGDSNKFYRKSPGGEWQKFASNEVELAHVRDIIASEEGDILMAGNHRRLKTPEYPSTAITTDDGVSFQGAGVTNLDAAPFLAMDFNWFFSLFEYQQQIYATSGLLNSKYDNYGSISLYNPEAKSFAVATDLYSSEFIPQRIIRRSKQADAPIVYRLWHPIEFQDYLFYPARSYSYATDNYRQAYMNSLGFFYKQDIGKRPKKVKLPRRAVGEDLLIINNELYVLANRALKDGKYKISVFKTNRAGKRIRWRKVLQFSSSNKARSFEYLDNKFYFGLGQDYGEAIASSGDILSYYVPSLEIN